MHGLGDAALVTGIVVSLGSKVSGFQPGDRVGLRGACFECKGCQRRSVKTDVKRAQNGHLEPVISSIRYSLQGQTPGAAAVSNTVQHIPISSTLVNYDS